MKKLGETRASYLTLPPNLQNHSTEAMAYAIDRQFAKLLPLAKAITVWSDLDNVDPKYYDYLALCIHVQAYKTDYTNAQKLNLLKNGLNEYFLGGTRKALDDLLIALLDTGEFQPWYQYGGNPYHFKIITDDTQTADLEAKFLKMLKDVKSARSILDAVELARVSDNTLYIADEQLIVQQWQVHDRQEG